MKLSGSENNERLKKIENGGDWSAASVKDLVRYKTGNQRACRGHKRNRRGQDLELSRTEIHVVHLLHEERKPLIDPLTNGASTSVRAGYDPDYRIRHDNLENVENSGLDVTARFLIRID